MMNCLEKERKLSTSSKFVRGRTKKKDMKM